MPTTYSILMKGSDGFYQPLPTASKAALTAKLTVITHDAPGTPNYTLTGQVTNSSAYGLTTADEVKTLLAVIKNLQTRVNELETQMQAWNLLT